MAEKLGDRCKKLIIQHAYKECEKNWEIKRHFVNCHIPMAG